MSGLIPCLLPETFDEPVTSDLQFPDQQDVARWFDGAYRDLGFDYLRPFEAYPIFLQLLDAQRGHRLLDVACGPGLLLKASRLRGVIPSGVDISEVAVSMAQELVPEADVRVANAESLPFEDRQFDLVTCIGSLERMFNREKALEEMRRVTKPGGRLCVMLRNASAPGWRIWRRLLRRQNFAGHQDARDLESWRDLLESAGFSVENIVVDQWGRQKLRRWLRCGRRPDFSTPEPIARPWTSLRWAYEHVFLLRR